MESESYVKPSYVKLLVSQLERSREFYEALGFQVVHRDPVFVHVRWAPYADLYLVATPAGLPLPSARGAGVLLCYSSLETPLEELAERARRQHARVEGPSATPWHTLECIVTDPDGYRVNFARPREG